MKVDLTTNVNTGGDAQGDSLSGIENLTGSAFADTLVGDGGVNRLDGGETAMRPGRPGRRRRADRRRRHRYGELLHLAAG